MECLDGIGLIGNGYDDNATPISELFSKEAIRLIVKGYQYTTENGKEHWVDRAKDFQIAATYAGYAITSAGCAAVHALSYPIGGSYHIPHGEANYLVFAATLRKYKEKAKGGKLDRLESLLGKLLHVSTKEAMEQAFSLFDQILHRRRLRDFGISEHDLHGFTESVQKNQGRLLKNNYISLTEEEIMEIYRQAY